VPLAKASGQRLCPEAEKRMNTGLALNLAALATLLPAALVGWRSSGRGRNALLYAVLAIAVVGPSWWVVARLGGEWRTGFADALWVSVAAAMALFLVLVVVTENAWRLTPLLMPLLLVFGLLGTFWHDLPERPVAGAVPPGWLDAHILFAVTTYGLITIAAVASLAVFLQERAFKAKQPTRLTRLLPAMAESERLELGLLTAAEAVLALGLASGMAAQYFLGRALLPFDHKTLFSVAAFIVIGGLLIARRSIGIRGKRVARLGILAFVLLTLAYPGVKFVTDVILT